MRSRSVIVIEIGSESSSQRGFMEHDHMIEAFATNGANHPLDVGSLPRRARCRQDFANAHVSHVFSEVIAQDRIAVAQEGARGLGKGKCLARLLSGPLCGRVS